MTRDELAQQLNGNEIGNEIDKATAAAAKASGLVVVYGASDDLMEFRGAIEDEAGAPGKIPITRAGLLQNKCGDEDCPYFESIAKLAVTIEAVWSPDEQMGPNSRPTPTGDPTWYYVTAIPHATFDIKSDDQDEGIYCRGIVFELAEAGE